jgi:ERCC4-type nuclease
VIWVSPTEPKQLRDVADQVSMFPEEFGVDVLVAGAGEMIGVQRKTIKDFVASVEDGRLAEQIMKMQRLDHAMVLLEGRPMFVNDVLEIGSWGREISKRAWQRMVMTIRASGVHVETVNTPTELIEYVEMLDGWCASEDHSTLTIKGEKPSSSKWGDIRAQHYRVAMLSSLPGVGEELAKRMIAECGWPLTIKDGVVLSDVQGLGAKKLAKIMEVLQ